MLTLTAADTLAAGADVGSLVTSTVDGMELSGGIPGTTETYKVLDQRQLASAPATIYTVPAGTTTFIRSIHVVNTDAGATHTFQYFRGGTAAANALTPPVTLPAGGWATYSSDGWRLYNALGQLQGQGVTGPVGAMGAQGIQGPLGYEGEQGETGDVGPVGLTGATGATGSTGVQGVQGIAGPPGSGDDGDEGQIGPPGVAGAAGIQGLMGYSGADGSDGDAGDMGIPGLAGAAGATGQSGAPGTDGEDGQDGFAGLYPHNHSQISDEVAEASEYLARIKAAADTQYRAILGLDASSRGQLLMGPGTAVGDARIFRNAAGQLYTDANGAAVDTLFAIQATLGQASSINVNVAGDTFARLSFRGDSGRIGHLFGSGAANYDLRAYRLAAASLLVDSNSTANATKLGARATAGQRSLIQADVAGDTTMRAVLSGDATETSVSFGPGNAALDLRAYRSTTKTWTFDDTAAGAITVSVIGDLYSSGPAQTNSQPAVSTNLQANYSGYLVGLPLVIASGTVFTIGSGAVMVIDP